MEQWFWLLWTFAFIWMGSVAAVFLWVIKKVIPGIHTEMDEMGLDEVQRNRIIVKAVFPPRFYK